MNNFWKHPVFIIGVSVVLTAAIIALGVHSTLSAIDDTLNEAKTEWSAASAAVTLGKPIETLKTEVSQIPNCALTVCAADGVQTTYKLTALMGTYQIVVQNGKIISYQEK